MMENAGRNLAELAMEVLGAGWREPTIAVLAGTGGNGGGGICAARHLANRGIGVVLCLTDPERLGTVPGFVTLRQNQAQLMDEIILTRPSLST